jgi:diguanylate cyclase (GGDEF)-like protein
MRLRIPLLGSTKQENFVRRMVIGAVLASLLVGFLVVLVLAQGYRQRQEQAVVTVENLSWVIEQNLRGSINLIDHALLSVSDEASRQMQDGGALDLVSFNAFLARQNARLPNADGLRATNAEGATLYGEGVIPGANAVGRDYFIKLRDNPNAGLAMSKPLIGRISNKWAVIFARRLNKPDGSFAGVVFSPINLESFTNIFSQINVGLQGAVSLFDSEAALVVRYPEQEGFGSTIGKKVKSNILQELIKTGNSVKAYKAKSQVDDVDRLYSSRKIKDYPLYISVGLNTEDYLEEWKTNAITLISIWLLFTLVFCSLTIQTVRGWRQRMATLKTLEENAELEAKVADRTRDLEESNRKLSALSATDGLTGIANRRRFDETFAQEWNRAARTGQTLALVLFDVDLFKNYNDHYGHLKGDDCLRKVAHLLHGHARRSGDLVARYGGEEFAFMAPGMDAEAVFALTETIRKALECLEIPHAMSPLTRVTISAGVAVRVPGFGDPLESLVTLADQALYRAKREGRNRTILAEDVVAAG